MGGCHIHRVLHVLANGPPDVNGYAVRTHALLHAQLESEKISVIGLTSPWYPERESLIEDYNFEGVNYIRTIHPAHLSGRLSIPMRWVSGRGMKKIAKINSKSEINQNTSLLNRIVGTMKYVTRRFLLPFTAFIRPFFSWIEERILFKHFTNRIIEVATNSDVDVIHAHVPYRVGLPALKAARKLGIPFVYEMRGMWEESAVASGRWRAGGIAHRRFRRLETKVMKDADALICISETLRNEAISRGINSEKISVVPNAVELKKSEYEESDIYDEVEKKIGNSAVVGYIGSLRELEGVDRTAEAASILINRGIDVKLFVLSSEPGQSELLTHCKKLGIAEHTIITGPVPHNQVAPFYDLIDVFVVSRPNKRVTRLVTPLKPFEAMQAGCAIVMSDLPALAEIVNDGQTGRLYPPDDIEALADTIEQLLLDEDERTSLGIAASEWILEHRTWSKVVNETPDIYHRLIQDSGR